MDENALAINLRTYDRGIMRYRDRTSKPRLRITGTTENYLITEFTTVVAGRMITRDDVLESRAVTVLGSEIAQDMFGSADPIGEIVRIVERRYLVIGVLKKRGSFMGRSKDDFTLIPISTAIAQFGVNTRGINIAIRAKSHDTLSECKDDALSSIRVVRKLKPEDENNFRFRTNEGMLKNYNEMVAMIQAGGFIISAIALLTAGVGIMNIMLVSVTERTREIGLRKSLGAKKRDILWQFLLEAILLSELGGVTGLALGVVAGDAIAYYLEAAPVFPWGWAFFSLGICSFVGIVFGLYPAWKAAELHPVDALRFE